MVMKFCPKYVKKVLLVMVIEKGIVDYDTEICSFENGVVLKMVLK